MALREIKTKIASLQNTGKITKAMEVVSSVKLKKVEKATLNANVYLDTMKQFLYEAVQTDVDLDMPLFDSGETETKDVLVIVIGSGKGLVGPLLHQLKSKTYDLINELEAEGITPHLISVKSKTLDVFRELNLKSEFHFSGAFEEASATEITPLKKVVLDYYPSKVQRVYVVFMKFRNAFIQEAVAEKFIPLSKEDFPQVSTSNSTFEPSSKVLLEHLLEDYLEAFLIYVLLNSSCSEYASRVVTMKSATKNASELRREYQLQYNKQRQTQITSQIQETYLSSYIQ